MSRFVYLGQLSQKNRRGPSHITKHHCSRFSCCLRRIFFGNAGQFTLMAEVGLALPSQHRVCPTI